MRKSLIDMARPARFERATAWFVARYSIQLSYGRVRGRTIGRMLLCVKGLSRSEIGICWAGVGRYRPGVSPAYIAYRPRSGLLRLGGGGQEDAGLRVGLKLSVADHELAVDEQVPHTL